MSLVTIGSNAIPDSYINKSTYKTKHEKQKILSYYDADYKYHEELSSEENATITFVTHYLTESQISTLLGYITGASATITYYSTKYLTTKTGTFLMPNGLEPKLYKSAGTEKIFRPLSLVFTECVGD